jgi:hypothetical protein
MANRVNIDAAAAVPLDGMHRGESPGNGGSVGMVIMGGGGNGHTFDAGFVPASVRKVRRVETMLSLGPRALITVPAGLEFLTRNINCVVDRLGDWSQNNAAAPACKKKTVWDHFVGWKECEQSTLLFCSRSIISSLLTACGPAMLVPEMVLYDESSRYQADEMKFPGANTSTHGPWLENEDRQSSWSTDPTVKANWLLAGEKKQAFMSLFPAATCAFLLNNVERGMKWAFCTPRVNDMRPSILDVHSAHTRTNDKDARVEGILNGPIRGHWCAESTQGQAHDGIPTGIGTLIDNIVYATQNGSYKSTTVIAEHFDTNDIDLLRDSIVAAANYSKIVEINRREFMCLESARFVTRRNNNTANKWMNVRTDATEQKKHTAEMKRDNPRWDS